MYETADHRNNIFHYQETGPRRVNLDQYHIDKSCLIEYYFGGIFRLRDNTVMTHQEQIIINNNLNHVEQAITGADDYIKDRDLSTAIFKPQNQWADIVIEGKIPEKSFNNLNWTRIVSPFTGYHLVYLDRLDHGGHFAQPYPPEVLKIILGKSLPDDLPDLMERYVCHHERLAWVVPQYFHSIRNLPSDLIVSAAPRGGEVGVMINGRIVNPDTLQVQARINAMYTSGLIGLLRAKAERCGRVRVLEVGPGYGALARALGGIFLDRIDYVMIDLPQMIHYSATYLTLSGIAVEVATPNHTTSTGTSHRLVPNYLVPEIEAGLGHFDLVINTMSMNEMSVPQVQYYADLISRLLGPDGVFYEENAASISAHIDCRAVFAHRFPFRRHVRSFHAAAGLGQPFIWASAYVPQIYDRWDWSLP